MSSWIRSKSLPAKHKVTPVAVYHDTSSSTNVISMYMDVLASYIYNQKLGEFCTVWDPIAVLTASLKSNPQVKLLKVKPEEPATPTTIYVSTVSSMKLVDIQKYASTLFQYTSSFTTSINHILEKASIKSTFDMGIHLSETNLATYVDLIKAYQLKSKKTTMAIYVMADSYSTVTAFQKLGSPSWTVVSLSKTPNTNSQFLQTMAEVQIMSVLPALILDFSNDVDRFIYVMRPNKTQLDYFREVNGTPWHLL